MYIFIIEKELRPSSEHEYRKAVSSPYHYNSVSILKHIKLSNCRQTDGHRHNSNNGTSEW